MASTYLTRTPASAGNRKTWTYSAWFKIGNVSTGSKRLLTSYDGSTNTNQSTISYGGAFDYVMQIYNAPSGTPTINLITNRLFRDCNAWYHIVISVDTTQATESDRVKLYVNGVQETSFSTELYGSQNEDFWINSNQLHTIGRRQDNSQYFDGSMTHVHFIDGTAYDADTFGQTDSTTGIWTPKTAPSVTYGTNGFFLKFENSGAFGTDSSGNGNNFTVNGTMTQTIDTPSNVFATLNVLEWTRGSEASFSNGNLSVQQTVGVNTHRRFLSTLGMSQGKWYWESKCTANVTGFNSGITDGVLGDYSTFIGNQANDVGYNFTGVIYKNGSQVVTGLTAISLNDIVMYALDLDNNYIIYHQHKLR